MSGGRPADVPRLRMRLDPMSAHLAHDVFQLALRCVEAVADRDVYVLVCMVFFAVPAGHYLSSGYGDVDLHMVYPASVTVPMRRFDDHGAGGYPIV